MPLLGLRVPALTAATTCAPPPPRSLFMSVREETAVEEPALSVAYLQGSNRLLALACGLSDPALLACT